MSGAYTVERVVLAQDPDTSLLASPKVLAIALDVHGHDLDSARSWPDVSL
jgi:hypothetical protein